MNRRVQRLLFLFSIITASVVPASYAQTKIEVPGSVITVPPPSANNGTESIKFVRINLGPKVNSKYNDLFPVLTPDETVLFFVRKGDPENVGYAKNHEDEDIWYSTRLSDGSWSNAVHMGPPLNTNNYDGVRAINSTATHLYLQNIYHADGTGDRGFSVSIKQPDGSWSFPKPLVIDDYYNKGGIAMMSISSDEKTMILSLDRKDSKGQHDFYVSHNLGGLHWSKPEHIAELSTAGDEISPFIAYDDHTLYFSSNGRGGYGGYDIFIARRLDSTWMHWSVPRNMGQPINTPSFDAYFTLGARGDTAYFSSADPNYGSSYGKSDIWKIGLKSWQEPGFHLPNGQMFDSSLSARDLKGSLFRLDDVHFGVGKSTVNAQSRVALRNVVEVMKRLPSLRIEVQGHTDSKGDPKLNLALSQKRAEAVRRYLIRQGIDPSRLTARGYGMTRPIAPNNTPQGRALNRRVMIEVMR